MQRLLNSRQTTQSIEVICKSRVAPFFSSLQIEDVVLWSIVKNLCMQNKNLTFAEINELRWKRVLT